MDCRTLLRKFVSMIDIQSPLVMSSNAFGSYIPNDIYVADGYGKFYIHHYDAKTNYVRTFGGSREEMERNPGKETAAGTTIWPHTIAVDTRGPKPLHTVKDGVHRPSISEFREGMILMPDLKAVVHLGDGQPSDGKTDEGIRNQNREAFTAGKFVAPHDACFDREQNIFVAEWVEVGRVSKLSKLT